jgi:addiction module HigA family antidote
MISYRPNPPKVAPTHPGELMREILDEHVRLPIAEAACRMQISRPSLYAVLSGKSAVSAEMALKFARLVKAEPTLYLNMQAAYDLWCASRKLKATLDEIKPAA